jgi:phosphate transport system permease protein
MATERRDALESFGQVSRTVGIVFRYALLVATLAGIVALGVLLVYVSLDALKPFTADPGWYAVYGATFALPSLVTAGYLRWYTEHGFGVGLTALGIPVVGLLFGSGVAVLFIDVVPTLAWLGYVLAVALPLALLRAVQRVRPLPFLARILGGLVLLGASLAVVPGAVTSLPFVPMDWLVLVATLALPVGLLVWRLLGDGWTDRTGAVAGGATVAATVAAAFVGPFAGITSVPAVILPLSTVVPFGVYAVAARRRSRRETERDDQSGLLLPAAVVGGVAVGLVLVDVLGFAGPGAALNWELLTSTTVTDPESAGVYPALVGSILLMIIVALAAFPVGVGAAVYLEEYAPDNRYTRIVQVNISNLAGVPSIVYGLLGLGVFIRYAGSPPGTVLVGGLTLALLILPIVIISAQEAIRSVPGSLRQASYGMGATRWQTVRTVVLPRAFPGILTGTILALGRAIGETAPLLVIGAPNVFDVPTELSARVGALPLQIFVWATTFASPKFYSEVIPAAVIVLLTIMLTMNSIAIVLRNRYQREA